MKLKILFLILITTIINFSQTFHYKILKVNDNVFVGTYKTWKKAFPSQLINLNDLIKVAPNGMIIISNMKNKIFELKKEGIYNLKNLDQYNNDNDNNIFSKFINFLEDELIKDDSKKVFISGAVTRNLAIIESDLPESTKIFSDKIEFKWNKYLDNDEYIFNLSDRFGKIVIDEIIKDTFYTFVNIPNILNPNEYYFWQVYLKNNKDIRTKLHYIETVSQKQYNSIQDTIKSIHNFIKKIANDNEESLKEYFLAKYYARNGYNYNANDIYEKNQNMFSENQWFANAYIDFLTSNSLLSKAMQIKNKYGVKNEK